MISPALSPHKASCTHAARFASRLQTCRDSEKQDVNRDGNEDAKRNLPPRLLPLVFAQA
jgi:hypothetical protein